jgi:hypothetical protein
MRAEDLTASDAGKARVGPAFRKAPRVQNTTICCRLFQIWFSSSDASQYSGSLFGDLRVNSLITTRETQTNELREPLMPYPRHWYPQLITPRSCELRQRKILGALGKMRKATSFVISVRLSFRLHRIIFVKIRDWLKSNKNNGRFTLIHTYSYDYFAYGRCHGDLLVTVTNVPMLAVVIYAANCSPRLLSAMVSLRGHFQSC